MFFSSDPASPGGVQEHAYHLAAALKKIGHKVTVFVPNRRSILLPYPNARTIGEFSEIPLPIGYDISYISKKEGENYAEMISGKKFDFIHIHDPFMPFLTYELLNVLKLPIVTTYHATWETGSALEAFRGFLPWLKDPLSKKVVGSIFVSRRTMECWREIFNDKTEKSIIANGIDRSLFRKKAKTKKDRTEILFLARLVPKKGLHLLLKSIKILVARRKNIRLSVVGEGPDKQRMIDYVRKNKLGQYVKFHGYVKKKDKPRYYQQADIFCAPYVNEGFGITLLEAMATGTPIVALENNAFSEVLKTYPASELIVKEKNAVKMADAIETLIDDEKLKQKIVKWEEREIKKYGWEKIAKETEKFYLKILGYS